ncbi:hypothetical protein N7470_006287 [Penicillium chermesinum]|nr:hypothetical protein N7470_006287 [Penicillium chermesinum]
MDPQLTKDTFCTYTGPEDQTQTTIFFVTGNPGLISYYHPFLSLLARNLAGQGDPELNATQPSFQIYGCSLAGFEVDEDPRKPGLKHALYDVEDQIRFVHERLATVISKTAGQGKQRVILMGHSVGTYIAMEVLRRHRDGIPGTKDIAGAGDYDIIGAVMLFPTVKDIAHSPSGRKLTLSRARVLTFLLPSSVLKSVIRLVMKNPPPHALNATFDFLQKPGGVRQALYMAADEMRTITSDKWADDVWGIGAAREPIQKMFFYFGRNDHWVAEKTRDEIIELRGREGLGPKMFVCEEGLPHAFLSKA